MFNFLDIIFPSKCLGCKFEGSFICGKCFQEITLKKLQQCPICKSKINQGEVCQKCKNKSPLDGLLVSTSYEQNLLIKKSVQQFKYKFNENLAEKLAEILFLSLSSSFRQLKQSVQKSEQHALTCCLQNTYFTPNSQLPTILVPISIHFRRKWQRGFNQAELLAKHVSKKINLPVYNLLKRIKNTPQQAKLSRQDRLNNLQNAFAINQKEMNKLQTASLKSQEEKKLQTTDRKLPAIILIDDVASTLATLEEAALTLKKTGFKNVWGLVIARG